MDLVACLSLSTLRSCLGDGLPLEGHLGVSVAEVVLGLAALPFVFRTLPVDVVARKVGFCSKSPGAQGRQRACKRGFNFLHELFELGLRDFVEVAVKKLKLSFCSKEVLIFTNTYILWNLKP